MSRPSKKTAIVLPSLKEDRVIASAARSDPDARPLTQKQLKSMIPLRNLRGRPKSNSTKLLVSIRYSREVVAYFKSTGDGWQVRMDGVLCRYVAQHSRKAKVSVAQR